jgi:hypothetical protein
VNNQPVAINLANVPIQEDDNINEESNSSNKRGRYLKPTRDNAVAIIKKMIVEDNHPPETVRDMLKIPVRSFKRYCHQAFEEERDSYVKSVATTEILERIAIVEARLQKDRRDLIEFANNPNIDPKRLLAITEAYKVASSLNMASLKLHNELLPELFNQRRQMDYSDTVHVTVDGKRMTIKEWTASLVDDNEATEEGEEQQL